MLEENKAGFRREGHILCLFFAVIQKSEGLDVLHRRFFLNIFDCIIRNLAGLIAQVPFQLILNI